MRSNLINFVWAVALAHATIACSAFKTADGTAPRPDKNFVFEKIPKEWQAIEDEKAQLSFANAAGSIIYANSYCGLDASLTELAAEHVKSLKGALANTEEVLMAGAPGILSTLYVKQSGETVKVYNYGNKRSGCYYEINGIPAKGDKILEALKAFIQAVAI